ncbi:MAG: tyrosine-type recombinase/integrase [Acidobacteria bacterium]|nr:tyrosine-type recombinase/integrase [Acidobacteriota bacterium]
MRTPSRKTKPAYKPEMPRATKQPDSLKELIAATIKLWRKSHLTYDQARYVSKEARKRLGIARVKTRKQIVDRLSRDDEQKLIRQAYKDHGEHGLLIKTLFQSGARVSEFVSLRVDDLFFDEQMLLIEKGKGGKSRYVPILAELSQELRTHLGNRKIGYLFETNRHSAYSPRRVQQIVKDVAERAGITKRVYPHLLRHSVATTLLERGMPIDQIQKFLGHSKLETTQIYAESTTEMIKESYRQALGG